VRRKTTFLWHVVAERLARGFDREGLLYFNFEDERLAGLTAAHLPLVVEEYYRLHSERRDRRGLVRFLDEIQAVPGWEMFARRLLDTEMVELFLSGSSARLLAGRWRPACEAGPWRRWCFRSASVNFYGMNGRNRIGLRGG